MQTIKEENWAERYSLGNADLDKEHIRLCKIYNNLVEVINNNGDRKEFAAVLIDMYDYSQSHFSREEMYMNKLNFPFIEEHKSFHRKYLFKVSLFNSDLLGSTPPNSAEVLAYLRKWWSYHIPNSDKKYEAYKKDTGLNVQF